MSEFLPSNLELLNKASFKGLAWSAEVAWPKEMDPEKKMEREEEEEMVSSAKFEPATLQWREDRDSEKGRDNGSEVTEKENAGGEGECRSVRSECLSLHGGESRTESELGGGSEKARAPESWLETEMPRKRGVKGQLEIDVEDEEGEGGMNSLPAKAAQVFNPAITILHSSSDPVSPRESETFWNAETTKTPFLGPHGTPPDVYYQDWAIEGASPKWGSGCCNRDSLKMGVSVSTAALIFPLLVWGGYVFLPFDAPLLNSSPLRLVYTLRCSVFAVVPIVLGWLVLGVSRLRLGAVKPLCDGEVEAREVGVHRRFVDDSISLFLLYFLQLAVMAPYLSQDLLKLVPLLTIIFAFGRLVYWAAAALGSSIRGFGFGLSFLPTVAMLGANLYFIFAMDAKGTIFAQEAHVPDESPSSPRQRFWG
ncbi:transmembrane protein 79 [Osmerus eperlanus]|uniref:transmembrane protein 79 n=1 Tax=Osmerus eperlanus TaxID=29151 RepID=UPI002E1105CA